MKKIILTVIARTAQQSAKPIKNKSIELNEAILQTRIRLPRLRLAMTFLIILSPLLWRGVGGEVSAQTDTTSKLKTDSNQVRYEDWEYVPNIKSVLLHDSSFILSAPIIDFDAGQQLELEFDDLDGDSKTYFYTLIHCDAFWKPSALQQQEYLSNYTEEQITTFTFSQGTVQRYTHYVWSFPNANMSISKTGNYLLEVYTKNLTPNPSPQGEGNKGEGVSPLRGDGRGVVFTRRLMVYATKVSIKANIHQAAASDDYVNKQEVDFSIFYPDYSIPQINNLKVIIQQNSRWDNAIYNIQPIYYKPNELSYDYDDGTNDFNGGNEYRAAIFKNFTFVTGNTDKMYQDSLQNWHVNLLPDEVKTFKRYSLVPDINGRFLITVEQRDSTLIDIIAEYAHVHFKFPFDYPMDEGDMYLLGKLCDNHFTQANKMTFNYFTKMYEGELYLKQGYYDYMYVFLPDTAPSSSPLLRRGVGGEVAAQTNQIEGDHWETENDYTIYVYHQEPGSYYDRLICVQKFNSVIK
ncbi:MAG: type IX secretion system plug protein [Bacteroidia bacterium]